MTVSDDEFSGGPTSARQEGDRLLNDDLDKSTAKCVIESEGRIDSHHDSHVDLTSSAHSPPIKIGPPDAKHTMLHPESTDTRKADRLSPANSSRALDALPRGLSNSKIANLGLSGNVLSVNFCLPYESKYTDLEDWQIFPRKGTSALFDSFAHLASTDSTWNHTLVGWTGEIERISSKDELKADSASATNSVVGQAAAPVSTDGDSKHGRQNSASEVHIPPAARKELKRKLERQHSGRILPVWLPDGMDESDVLTFRQQDKWRHYGEYEIYTLFHYKQQEPSDGRATKKAWNDYIHMNSNFANAVMSIYRPGDIVFIHDHQLLLLPGLLRRLIPNMYIGYFLHVPFPTSELFRTLPMRQDILESVLCADMIGFQTQNYVDHFRLSCIKTLNVEASIEGTEYNGFTTAFEVLPIGINAAKTIKSAFSPEVDERMQKLHDEKVYHGKKIIVGRDRLDSARGVTQKLQAFELFLEKYPEWVERVVLVQVTNAMSLNMQDEKREKLESTVARINGNVGHLGYTPVQYYTQHLSKEEYFALLRIADLGLITSVRDGMNTTALEYVVCQQDKKSPLVISEFSGTAAALKAAIHINPWDLAGVADQIHRALTMSEDQKARQHQRLHKTVTQNSVQAWTSKCIDSLITNLLINDRCQMAPSLDRAELDLQYSTSSKRLFMFDYDGTLTPIVRDPDMALPTHQTISTLTKLASDKRNIVWIVSGRDQHFLDANFSGIANLGLSAEHGCFIRYPQAKEWENLLKHFDMKWQDEVLHIFEASCKACLGSFTERKRVALTWHYRKAEDATQAAVQAEKCVQQLKQDVVGRYEVHVMTGKANVEVRPVFINKGEIVKKLLAMYGGNTVDFVFCAGDDSTDEDMFNVLRSSSLPRHQVFAVTVGPSSKPTLATSHIEEPEDVVETISNLTKLN